MMVNYNFPPDLPGHLKALENRIRVLERRASQTTGASTDTGTLAVGSGTTGLPMLLAGTKADGTQGVEIRRNDGTLAIFVGYLNPGDTRQRVIVYDADGTTVLLQDGVPAAPPAPSTPIFAAGRIHWAKIDLAGAVALPPAAGRIHWAKLDLAGAVSVEPVNTDVLAGLSKSGSNFVTLQQEMGKNITWVRGYDNSYTNAGSTGIPTSWSAANDGSTRMTVPHVHLSFKIKSPGDTAGVVAGTYDAALQALASTMPPNCRITPWHEPEGSTDMPGSTDLARATAYRDAFTHIYNVMKPLIPVSSGIGQVFTVGLWYPNGGHYANLPIWLGSPSDFIGLDGYNSYGNLNRAYQSGSSVFNNAFTWIAANKGVNFPVVISEWGSTYGDDPSTPGYGRDQWIRDTWAYFLTKLSFVGGYYWSSGKYRLDRQIDRVSGTDSGLVDQASINAFSLIS